LITAKYTKYPNENFACFVHFAVDKFLESSSVWYGIFVGLKSKMNQAVEQRMRVVRGETVEFDHQKIQAPAGATEKLEQIEVCSLACPWLAPFRRPPRDFAVGCFRMRFRR